MCLATMLRRCIRIKYLLSCVVSLMKVQFSIFYDIQCSRTFSQKIIFHLDLYKNPVGLRASQTWRRKANLCFNTFFRFCCSNCAAPPCSLNWEIKIWSAISSLAISYIFKVSISVVTGYCLVTSCLPDNQLESRAFVGATKEGVFNAYSSLESSSWPRELKQLE